ncbi:MAG: tRNA (adenosine(37)-N6)-dimethylallyltransferase MiaA [Bacilli bacterium]|nr:tRNA (adenosine(37)-N6)-dimethylallyltransferase MiaA [Bacilli bacterium]
MIYAILGPTCSGKSDLAEKLSRDFNFPIINFDAFQVYKEIKKGTAKPIINEENKARYYLYDFVSVLENFDVMNYQNVARKILKKFDNDNVILVGGTGLYLKALLYDYKFLEEEKMPDDYLKNLTNDELYERLLSIDENDALKIGKNNRKRLLRALYIYEIHGKNKTELNENGKDKLLYKNVKFIGLNPDREKLYHLINKRVDKMFEDGLVDEVKELFSKYDSSLRAFQAIGYKEFLNNEDLELAKEEIKKNTRNYAKRQLTFFKNQFNNVNWFDNVEEAYFSTKNNY